MDKFRDAFVDRFSAAVVADAAYRAGVQLGVVGPGLYPLNTASKIAGPAVTVQANNDLTSIILAVHRARPGDVVVVANGPTQAGLMGDIIASDAARAGVSGMVVDGLVRDVNEILDVGLSVFARGRVPIGPLKLPDDQKGTGVPGASVQVGGAEIRPGDWVIGDNDGVLILQAADLAKVYEFAEKALEGEAKVLGGIRNGIALGDQFAIEEFWEKRQEDPSTDFNEHLASLGGAI